MRRCRLTFLLCQPTNHTPQYIEVDIDISANNVASYVTGLVRGATRSLVIDMGFVLEGERRTAHGRSTRPVPQRTPGKRRRSGCVA